MRQADIDRGRCGLPYGVSVGASVILAAVGLVSDRVGASRAELGRRREHTAVNIGGDENRIDGEGTEYQGTVELIHLRF